MSASTSLLISRSRAGEALARAIRRECISRKRMTFRQLADESGVSERMVRAFVSNDPNERREADGGELLSMFAVLGPKAASIWMGEIDMTAHYADGDENRPGEAVAEIMENGAIIARAAADGRIDHTEEPDCQEASERIIQAASQFRKRSA